MAVFYDVAKKSVNRRAYSELRSYQSGHHHPEGMEASLREMEAADAEADEQAGAGEWLRRIAPIGALSMWDDWSKDVQVSHPRLILA